MKPARSSAKIAPERVRITLELSPRLNDEVDRMAADRNVSKADVLRLAVEFLATSLAAKKAGMAVGAWAERNGTRVEREFVGL